MAARIPSTRSRSASSPRGTALRRPRLRRLRPPRGKSARDAIPPHHDGAHHSGHLHRQSRRGAESQRLPHALRRRVGPRSRFQYASAPHRAHPAHFLHRRVGGAPQAPHARLLTRRRCRFPSAPLTENPSPHTVAAPSFPGLTIPARVKPRIQSTEEADMRKAYFLFWLVLGAIPLAAIPAGARQKSDSSGGAPVSAVVTVLGPKFTPPPAVSRDDINVSEGEARKQVTDWVPAQGDKAGLQLAIVVDDSDRKDVGKQFDDLTNFIKALPPSTSVGIYYARDNTISVASQFSPDHEAVAKTLRLPVGNGAVMSIYQSLMALIAGWPVTGARREI